jgi:putative FmdB family regulatory protein
VPIYEYTCGGCKAKFEQLVRSMHSNARVTCPTCGSDQTARAMSVFAVSSGSAKTPGGSSDDLPSCGRCGGAPGSCQD